jgi:pyruvate/2-oxoglutarate dehydrogenase complex dihydrolipoamide dehydrogenase (E3) component
MSEKPSHFDFDLAIIGGGSAGYASARTAAQEGLKTVVIEGGEEVGGLCILRGCMPTKALLYASEVMHLTRNAKVWGLNPHHPGFDFQAVMARKNSLIKEFADYRHEQLLHGRFKFLRARARFLDPHTLELAMLTNARFTTGDESTGDVGSSKVGAKRGGIHKITAKHFLITTGSKIAPSPLPQIEDIDCLDSDSALELDRLPKSLIVLGGGAVAVEFAQFFARFGVQVSLVQRSPHVLHEFDIEASAELEKVFRREGIEVYTKTKLIDARCDASRKEIVFEHNGRKLRLHAEQVFFALGRVPNTAGLGLENIGVKIEYARIATNANMQTTVPHIYAAGDCAGPYEIVHIAVQQGEIAAYNIAHPSRRKQMNYRLLTEVIFTEPQIASVGLTEKRAHLENIPYTVASYCFKDHGKSLIMEAKDGFVKLLADPVTGEIIGGACVGPVAGELIHEIIVAMHSRMTVRQLASLPHYHPTLAEIWTYPAEELADRIEAK